MIDKKKGLIRIGFDIIGLRIRGILNIFFSDLPKEKEQSKFDEFFREVYLEIDEEYGEIEEMNICDNTGEHMLGNVYVKVS